MGKNRYDQLCLALSALVLLLVCGFFLKKISAFPDGFTAAKKGELKPVSVSQIDINRAIDIREARSEAEQPSSWQLARNENPHLFVPQRFVIDHGVPRRVTETSLPDTLSERQIPSAFFLDHNLNPLDATVTVQDQAAAVR